MSNVGNIKKLYNCRKVLAFGLINKRSVCCPGKLMKAKIVICPNKINAKQNLGNRKLGVSPPVNGSVLYIVKTFNSFHSRIVPEERSKVISLCNYYTGLCDVG